jgi:hypothetical protein
MKIFIQTYPRGNDFGTINIFVKKIVDDIFWLKPISEEMILHK